MVDKRTELRVIRLERLVGELKHMGWRPDGQTENEIKMLTDRYGK